MALDLPAEVHPPGGAADESGEAGVRWHAVALPFLVALAVSNAAAPLPKPAIYACVMGASVLVTLVVPAVSAPAALLSIVPGSAIVGASLVPTDVQFAAVLASFTALVVAWRRHPSSHLRHARLPSRAILWCGAAYLGTTLASALASSHRAESLGSAASTGGVLVFAFVVAPTLGGDRLRRDLVGTVIATTTALSLTAIALWITGPIDLLGRSIGDFAPNRIVTLHNPTDLVVPRVSGIYGTPGYQSIAVMCGLLALVAVAPWASDRARLAVVAAAIVHSAALIMTMSRGGWLGLCFGTAAICLVDGWRRPALRAGVLIAFTALLMAVTLEWIGTSASPPDHGAGSDSRETTPALVLSRGGTQLESRALLWRASLDAIKAEPLFGAGPGRNARAIAPYLAGDHYDHLGSHNSVLRVAVETGVPGAIAYVALLVTALAAIGVNARRASDRRWLLAFAGIAVGLTVASLTETMLLGGVALPNLLWALTLGLGGRSDGARP